MYSPQSLTHISGCSLDAQNFHLNKTLTKPQVALPTTGLWNKMFSEHHLPTQISLELLSQIIQMAFTYYMFPPSSLPPTQSSEPLASATSGVTARARHGQAEMQEVREAEFL